MAAYKLRRQRRLRLTARLGPYWGKPAVRNLSGGGGDGVNGLMAILPRRPKGLTRMEAINLPTTAPPLCSTLLSKTRNKALVSGKHSGYDVRHEQSGFRR